MSTIDPTTQAHHLLTTTTRPLAEIGGSDELHNLALAHAGCNAERSKTAFQRLLDMIERMVEGSNGSA